MAAPGRRDRRNAAADGPTSSAGESTVPTTVDASETVTPITTMKTVATPRTEASSGWIELRRSGRNTAATTTSAAAARAVVSASAEGANVNSEPNSTLAATPVVELDVLSR